MIFAASHCVPFTTEFQPYFGRGIVFRAIHVCPIHRFDSHLGVYSAHLFGQYMQPFIAKLTTL